jgi:hypothetical protein
MKKIVCPSDFLFIAEARFKMSQVSLADMPLAAEVLSLLSQNRLCTGSDILALGVTRLELLPGFDREKQAQVLMALILAVQTDSLAQLPRTMTPIDDLPLSRPAINAPHKQ